MEALRKPLNKHWLFTMNRDWSFFVTPYFCFSFDTNQWSGFSLVIYPFTFNFHYCKNGDAYEE